MIFDLLMGVVSGGMTGILGGGLQLLFTWLNFKAETEKMRVQNQLEIDKINARSSARVKVMEGQEHIEEVKAIAASQESFNRSYLDGVPAPRGSGFWASLIRGGIYTMMGFVEFLRALIRPILTLYLVGATTAIFLILHKLLTAIDFAFDPSVVAQLYAQTVATILYLTVTCISWWFVTRNKAKAPELTVPKV